MATTHRRLLFSPLAIGPVTAPNRVVLGAHFTQFVEPSGTAGEPGFYGERYGRYLAERARGGAGVIIAGQAQVHPTTAYQMRNNALAWEPAAVPHFERVTAPVHEHGALAFLQLAHNGGVNDGTWSKLPVWAPSHVANYNEPPHALEPDEIDEVVEHFARSARHAAAGGFDGIEVHGAHGYLIHEFLSPRSNRRTDGYGGSLANRMRFCVEVLEAVRAATGDRVAVGIRLVGDEEARDGLGLTSDDAAEIAVRLEDAGLVDFVNVSIGTSGMGMVRPLYTRHLLGVYAAQVVKKAMRHTPVFAVHRILTPDEAEGILQRDEADAVTLVRAHRRPRLAREGARGTTRPSARAPAATRVATATSPRDSRSRVSPIPPSAGRRSWARQRSDRRRAPSGWSSWAVAPPGSRRHGWQPRAGTRSPCSSATRSWAARSAWPSACPGASSSPTSRTGARASAFAVASTSVWGSGRPRAMCSPWSPTPSWSPPADAPGGRRCVEVAPLPVPGSEQPFVIDHEQALTRPTSSVDEWWSSTPSATSRASGWASCWRPSAST